MKKILGTFLLLVLAGCGGGGGTTAPAPTTANSNAGTYVSAWANSNGEMGTSKITIASDGTVSGTITNTIAGSTTLSGTSDNAGNFFASYTYPGSVTGTLTGTAVKTGNFLNYSLVNKVGAATYTMAGKSILTTGTTPPNSTGSWRGNVTSSLSGAGLVNNSVTMSGETLVGTYANTTIGTSGTFVGVAVGNEAWYVLSIVGAGNCRAQGHAAISGVTTGSTMAFDYATMPWCTTAETGVGTLTKQ